MLFAWVIPVGLITTVPAAALTGQLDRGLLPAAVLLALLLTLASSLFFRRALSRYESVGQ